MQITLTAQPYRPSAPLTGSETVLYRASNLVLRGNPQNLYLEAYSGSLNLSEPIPSVAITGTVSFSPSSLTVTGTGTSFLDELHIGQMLLADTEVLVVRKLVSQTSFINDRLPITTETNVAASRLPILFPLNTDRGAMLRGNAIHFDKGTIVAVGSGILYKNGAVLPGDSLTATRRAQVALYDSSTSTYDVQPLGFDDVPAIANSAITVIGSGGTKNMPAGYYSFMLAYYSDVTSGYGNPTDVLLSGGTAGYQVSAANSTFQLDKGADSPPLKATGYIIYATAFSGSSAISQVNSIEGPWYELKRVPFSDFTANLYTFDYIDSDLSTTFATQDNDTPPDAEFVESLAGFINLVSTNGQGVNTAGREADTSPGPMVSPQGASNPDAFPATNRVPTEKGETIIGVVAAAGRLFPMTANTLQATTPTGLPTAPFTLRPFWKRGFVNPYNLTFFDDTLYGYSGNQMFRSIATGDTANEGYEFATDVEQQMAEASGGYVLLAVDPKNQQICVFLSAIRQNDAGYWVTEVYPFSPSQGWQPMITLSDDTRDMIVSGVCSAGSSLYFIAGGRRQGDTNRFDTWEWDAGEDPVDYFASWAYQDFGVELQPKVISRLRPKGKFTDATVSIFGVTPDTEIDVDDLVTGDNSILDVSLDDSTTVKQYEASKVRAKNLLMATARVAGTSTYDGTEGSKDQFHELVLSIEVAGGVK